MTKYITFSLLLVVNIAFAQSEKYYVTFVKGQANVKKNNKTIKVGDVLLSTDGIVFKDKSVKISCISPGKGRFDLNAQQTKASPTGELLAVLKSNLVPATTTYHLSTRSLTFDGYEPKTYFQSTATNNRIAIIENEVLPIASSYKIDDSNFFFIQYLHNGTTVTKKINQNEKGLIFNNELLKEGNPSKVLLCYQTIIAGKPKSSSIIEFDVVVVNKAELINELKVIKAHVGNNKKLLAETVTAHIYDNYGKMGQSEIDKLLL